MGPYWGHIGALVGTLGQHAGHLGGILHTSNTWLVFNVFCVFGGAYPPRPCYRHIGAMLGLLQLLRSYWLLLAVWKRPPCFLGPRELGHAPLADTKVGPTHCGVVGGLRAVLGATALPISPQEGRWSHLRVSWSGLGPPPPHVLLAHARGCMILGMRASRLKVMSISAGRGLRRQRKNFAHVHVPRQSRSA